jgi:hypothetical protein
MSFPYLKNLNCGLVNIAEIAALNIPILRSVNGSIWIHRGGNLNRLDAPSLVSVARGVDIYPGNLEQINFPALQHIGGIFSAQDNPAEYVENGIYVPNLNNVTGGFTIDGAEGHDPTCNIFNNMICRGLLDGFYNWCGHDHVGIASDPNSCSDTYPIRDRTLAMKEGVGLGTTFGALSLAGIVVWYYWRKRKHRARAARESRELEPRELESVEQLPKYREQDISNRGGLPAYRHKEVGDDGTRGMVSEGVGDTAVNPISVCGNGRILNESQEGILDVETHLNTLI